MNLLTLTNKAGKHIGGFIAGRSIRSSSGAVDTLWRGITSNAPPSIEYLAVAAGGGGGSGLEFVKYGAGGGGGGISTGTLSTPLSGTITVPAGTNSDVAGGPAQCFSAVSTGGSPGDPNNGPGGSQRNGGAGGTGTITGATGGLGSSSGVPFTNGGTGTTSSISGSSVVYSDGGGGARDGVGGSGGGGTGAPRSPGAAGGNGASNRGAGGGGGDVVNGGGGAGGSGIVIIRYSAAFDNLTSIGAGLIMSAESPNAASPKLSGGFKIYIFIGGTGTVVV